MGDYAQRETLVAISRYENQASFINLVAASNTRGAYVQECMSRFKFPHVAEGYAGSRFHEGGDLLDEIEMLAIVKTRKLLDCGEAIVQPWRCTNAIVSVCFALAKENDKLLGLSCSSGGYYATGSSKAHFLSSFFRIETYDVHPETHLLDYDLLEARVRECRPRILFCGDTSYSRIWNWASVAEIGRRYGSIVVADISQIVGLVAAGCYPSPMPHADVTVFATYKTLRGPRGAIITTRDGEIARKIRRALYPRTQGSCCPETIAGISAAIEEAGWPEFRCYAERVTWSARYLANALMSLGIRIVADGTDTHSFVIAVPEDKATSAKRVCFALRQAGMLTNRTPVPYERRSLEDCSGIRIGTTSIANNHLTEGALNSLADAIFKTCQTCFLPG